MNDINTRQKIYDLLHGFDATMLVTLGVDHFMHARPMAVAEVEDDGEIWLLTSASSRKIHEIAEDARALLVFQHGARQLSVSGRARVVVDPARVRRLWKEAYRVWFPDGPEDSDIALVAIDPVTAEFWDAAGANGLEYLWDAAKAYFSGMRPKPDGDQHGSVRL